MSRKSSSGEPRASGVQPRRAEAGQGMRTLRQIPQEVPYTEVKAKSETPTLSPDLDSGQSESKSSLEKSFPN